MPFWMIQKGSAQYTLARLAPLKEEVVCGDEQSAQNLKITHGHDAVPVNGRIYSTGKREASPIGPLEMNSSETLERIRPTAQSLIRAVLRLTIRVR